MFTVATKVKVGHRFHKHIIHSMYTLQWMRINIATSIYTARVHGGTLVVLLLITKNHKTTELDYAAKSACEDHLNI